MERRSEVPPAAPGRSSEVRPGEESIRWREVAALCGLVALVAAIGWIDWATGPDIGFSLFYLIPVVIAAWHHGRAGVVMVALAATAAWFLADYLLRESLLISLWNGFTRLAIYLSQGLLIAALREDRRRQAKLARTDPTTQLANSRSFREALELALEQSATVCVIYIDLDNFKRVNDSFGHGAGDALLEQSALAIRSSIRAQDLAARVGGDEFAILLTECEIDKAEATARRVVAGIGLLSSNYAGTDFGASAGVAFTHRSVPADELIKAADNAMYDAKRQHKGSVTVRLMTAIPAPS